MAAARRREQERGTTERKFIFDTNAFNWRTIRRNIGVTDTVARLFRFCNISPASWISKYNPVRVVLSPQRRVTNHQKGPGFSAHRGTSTHALCPLSLPYTLRAYTRFDWHATREYLCTRWFGTRPVFLSYPPRSLAGAACLQRWDFSSHPGANPRRRKMKIKALALPEVSAVQSRQYFSILIFRRGENSGETRRLRRDGKGKSRLIIDYVARTGKQLPPARSAPGSPYGFSLKKMLSPIPSGISYSISKSRVGKVTLSRSAAGRRLPRSLLFDRSGTKWRGLS